MRTATIESGRAAAPIEGPASASPGLQWMKKIGLVAGIAAFFAVAFIPSGLHGVEGAGWRPAYAAATVALMAVW